MSPPSVEPPHKRENLYGALAYASVVVTCFAGVFAPQRLYQSSEWMVPVVFALGAVYAAIGVLLAGNLKLQGRSRRASYFVGQCAIVTTILFLSPSRAFVGLLALPLVSQAISVLPPFSATLVTLYLFGVNLAVFVVPGGWNGLIQAAMSYTTAFVFTIGFTLITKNAVMAREREGKLRAEVEAANRLLRDHAAQTADLATTRERNRVAREIHDGVGHYLTVVKTQLDTAAALLPAQPERAQAAVIAAAKLAGDALDDVRRSVGALRIDAMRLPLPEALRVLTEETSLPVTVRVEGAARMLPPGIEHALFRSVQEGLTNIRKHAAATAAEIILDFRAPDRVTLAVTDDGKGLSETTATRGFGLLGIRERMEVLGGRVESGNGRSGGFALTIEVLA